jgi:hypothetical protein
MTAGTGKLGGNIARVKSVWTVQPGQNNRDRITIVAGQPGQDGIVGT